MQYLPLPICRIVYRYLYDKVLTQLEESFGSTLKLRSSFDYPGRIVYDSRYSYIALHWRVKYIAVLNDGMQIIYNAYNPPCWCFDDNMHYSIPEID